MERVLKIFEHYNGYANLQDLKRAGIHTDTLRKLVDENIIEKVKPGLYKLIDMPMVAHQSFIDVCLAIPKAVICLHSALSFYELTTAVPSVIMAAIPRESKPTKINYPPIDIYYFSENTY